MATYQNSPGNMALVLKSGDDSSVLFTFGTETNLTDCTVAAEFYSLVTGATVRSLSTSTSHGTAWSANIAIPGSVTSALPRGTYGWKLSWTAPGNSRRTVFEGVAEIIR